MARRDCEGGDQAGVSGRNLKPSARVIAPRETEAVIPGRCEASNHNAQLRIGESRDSGSGATHHPGMTVYSQASEAIHRQETVIASEAKQSMPQKDGLLRRFAPRNDEWIA
jgi:hypothetical protein